MSWITGDLDIHDVAFDASRRPVFVNTLFSCIATASDGASFKPLWRPSFISKLAPEDRCHLNGMAMWEGTPMFVTAISASDMADGWRDKRADGGILIETSDNRRVLEGLSMPHSPRVYDRKLWLLNSGTGELGFVDFDAPRFEPVAFCPGYARGLAFADGCAIVGLSLSRENRTFQGLPLDAALKARDAEARCGLVIVDLKSGDTVAWIRLEGVVRELYDVAFLPGVRAPAAIGFKTDDILRIVSIDEG
jgi:uncharacterized protein (TIGR03032 family)